MIRVVDRLVSVIYVDLKNLLLSVHFIYLEVSSIWDDLSNWWTLYINCLFYELRGFIRPGLPVQFVDFVLTVHFY